MRYAVLNGGKRARPLLVYATGEALQVPPAVLDIPAAAIELIHAYSLVHDDLPAMDDDDLRRGKPSCHRQYDEATAILVGDALQALAFQLLATAPELEVAAEQRLRMLEQLGGRPVPMVWWVDRRWIWRRWANRCRSWNWKPCTSTRPVH
ncbi:MAG: polyprenyl synthetase family protein [Thiolinea sp.]